MPPCQQRVPILDNFRSAASGQSIHNNVFPPTDGWRARYPVPPGPRRAFVVRNFFRGSWREVGGRVEELDRCR
jgi:hypothetical protein